MMSEVYDTHSAASTASSNPWPKIQVIVKGDYHSILAAEDIAMDTEIALFSGELYDQPNAHTLQVDDCKHVLCPGGPVYTNHSCEPNAYFMFLPNDPFPRLTAQRDILVGEEISFDYNTTEWEMSTPFDCLCGCKGCHGTIRGFKYLERKQQLQLLESAQISPFIRNKAITELNIGSF